MVTQIPIMPVKMEDVHRHNALQILHIVGPVLVAAYFLLTSTVSFCTLQSPKPNGTSPRKVLLWLVTLVWLSYIAEAGIVSIDSLANNGRFSSTITDVCAISNALVWMVMVMSLYQNDRPIWFPHVGSWLIALLAEALMYALELGNGITLHVSAISETIIQACRLLTLVALLGVMLARRLEPSIITDEESSPLLGQHNKSANGAKPSNKSHPYGSIADVDLSEISEFEDEDRKEDEDQQRKHKKRLQESGNWLNYVSSFKILFPLLWPSRNRRLQLNIVGVVLCLAGGRVLNVLMPRQLGILLDSLDPSQGRIPFSEAALYMLYTWLSSSVIVSVRYILWEPVELSAHAAISTTAYNKVMDMSRDYHDDKQSGELYSSIDQGASVVGLLDSLAFQTLPMFVDIAVAFFYLWSVFGPYMALVVIATTLIYLWCSIQATHMVVEPQRKNQALARKQYQLMYDTVGGWSSVSYFGRQSYEKRRYLAAVASSNASTQQVNIFHMISNSVRETVNDFGLIIAGILALYQIANGTHKVGSFAMLMSYWGNFTGRLAFFAHTQRQIRSALVNAELLLELLQKKPTVADGHEQFIYKKGTIDMHEVGFTYDGKKQTIKDFSFKASSGQKVALVGETGGGKSTILKLLFRFYDVSSGKIMIDGQDIRDVTLQSLRRCFGVVPQDPALFNTTVIENVRYSKLEASDEEIMEACKKAAIHDKILTFTNGYQTKVGENGVKLSGGELQRIAIARVLLKNPAVVLLDEATSAVDSETESKIQAALQTLTEGRTTITIAHRLSTIINADVVVVIKDGTIVEQGSPQDLLQAKGKFSELWLKQIGITLVPKDEDKAGDKADESSSGKTKIGSHTGARANNDGGKHSEEGSSSSGKSLRPTAPEFVPRREFVPRSQRGTNIKQGQSSDDLIDLEGGHDASDAKGKGGTSKSQHKQKAPTENISDSTGYDSQWDTCDSKMDGNKAHSQKKRQKPVRRRRQNNKSDPSGSNSRPNQFDASRDEPISNVSSEDSGNILGSRRVSAPGELAPNAAADRGQGAANRRRARGRHNRNRAANPSRDDSGALSGDTLHPSTPNPPQNTSNDGNTPAGDMNPYVNTTGNVRFAPEA